MIRVLAADGMEASAVKTLQDRGFQVVQEYFELEDLKKQVQEFDVLVVRSATKVRAPVIDAALETGKLKMIIRGGVGVDNIDVEYAESKGIKVFNTPNASSASVAELAIAHMFSLARYIYISNVTMREGKWEKKQYEGTELCGKTLGLVGFGRIAVETAKRAKALGMDVAYTNRSGPVNGYDDYRYMPLDELLRAADYISLHVPGSEDGKPVIGREEIGKMKDGVFIVNTARGGVVCEDSLLDALDSGKVAGAAIDVFSEEPTENERLYTHPKISLTPHVGGSTAEAQERIGNEVVEIILRNS
ncbi:MAG: D-2-hydroxyacid dehydrogenase [Clostridiales bacterium]|nr:D-2-hydroxyacid dehydrogenase [Clostridiales bacterium]